MRILVLNGGSSSFKCALHDVSQAALGSASAPAPALKETVDGMGLGSVAEALEPFLRRAGVIDVVGHRIVNGGPELRASTWITDQVRAAIAHNIEIAPAHNRSGLEAIDMAARVLASGVRQAAVFDTSFHATLDPAAYIYPGPYEWLEREGIRRYGFHGISYQYATRRTGEMLGGVPKRLLICHLGNGASLCAVREGASIDTTMGFTPLEGLMMGSRSGSLDPGIIVYLLRHRGYSADELDRILNQESGLLGVSGFSSDMREILRGRESGETRARLAFDVYVHRLVREAGAMIAVLGGLDGLVFTGGIGENCAPVREALALQLEFLGIRIDARKNADPKLDMDIAALGSSIPVLVIHAEEEWEIARECFRLAAPGRWEG